MAELTAADVENFTNGRLENDGDDGETARMLNAALAVARRDVGWHVSPLLTGDEVVLDGPRSRILTLPTLHLVTLTEVVEDGTTLDLDGLRWSVGRPATAAWGAPASIRKKHHHHWRHDHYRSITVTMDHGYTEAEAADWRQAILSMVDQMSSLPVSAGAGRSDADLIRKTVADIEYQWNPGQVMAMAEKVLISVSHILDSYRLPAVEFM